MTSPDLPPLDPDLAGLLDAERSRAEPPNLRAEVAAGLAPLLGGATVHAPSAAAATSGGASAWKAFGARRLAQVVLVSFAVGGLAGAWIHARSTASPPAVATSASAAPPPSAPSAQAAVPTITRPPDPAPSAPDVQVAPSAAPAKAASSARTPDEDLAAEQVLVETARAALGRGDAASALAAIDKHAREFPRGRLAEEREVLRVRALVLAGRTDEARTRAAAFRARYPKSVFFPLLDDALSP